MTARRERWEPWEDAALAEHYAEHGGTWGGWASEGLVKPAHATPRKIQSRAWLLGLSRRRTSPPPGEWSDRESAELVRAVAGAARSTGHTFGEAAGQLLALYRRAQGQGTTKGD